MNIKGNLYSKTGFNRSFKDFWLLNINLGQKYIVYARKLCYNHSQQKNTNSKGDFVLKTGVKVCFKNSYMQK